MSLYGIYGTHTPETCLINNRKTAETLVKFENSDFAAIAEKYKLNQVVAQYHSALEHTLLWVVDAEEPRLIEQFCIDTGIASFNYLKIVPLMTFSKGVIPMIRGIHAL